MAAGRLESLSGLDILLEAAAYHDRINTVTPPCGERRDIAYSHFAQSSPAKSEQRSGPASIAKLPPKKRIKVFSEVGNKLWLTSNRRAHSAAIKISPIKRPSKKPAKCPAGSAHRIWEGTDEDDAAATSARRFDAVGTETDSGGAASKEDKHSFTLYDERDGEHINAIHNVVRRDIWEGFVIDAGHHSWSKGDGGGASDARRAGRLARYDGTVGFRCRFCKDTPPGRRAERSAVYPRSLEKIYLANIRFQRDHIE